MPEFKFQIGQLVILKAGIAEAMMSARCGGENAPKHFTITARRAEECSGGVQLSYCIAPPLNNLFAHESELADSSEFNVEEYKRLQAEFRQEKRQADHDFYLKRESKE